MYVVKSKNLAEVDGLHLQIWIIERENNEQLLLWLQLYNQSSYI